MALQEELASQGNWLFRNRSLLPLAILFVGIAAHLFTLRTSGILFSTVFPDWHGYEIFCLIISMAGTFIRIYTVGHTPVRTSGRNTAGQVADSLNTTGIYSIVRHPAVLGELSDVVWHFAAYMQRRFHHCIYIGLLALLRTHYVCRRRLFAPQVWR